MSGPFQMPGHPENGCVSAGTGKKIRNDPDNVEPPVVERGRSRPVVLRRVNDVLTQMSDPRFEPGPQSGLKPLRNVREHAVDDRRLHEAEPGGRKEWRSIAKFNTLRDRCPPLAGDDRTLQST